jgi:hypothetical protein
MTNELVFQNLLVPSPDISIFRSIFFLQKWRVVMICDARGSCYDLRCKGKVIGGFGVDLWRIRVASYSTHGATVAAGTVNAEKVERGS